jgi:hypothetical protein
VLFIYCKDTGKTSINTPKSVEFEDGLSPALVELPPLATRPDRHHNWWGRASLIYQTRMNGLAKEQMSISDIRLQCGYALVLVLVLVHTHNAQIRYA